MIDPKVLEDDLRSEADTLGLRIRVSYDPNDLSYCVDSTLAYRARAAISIDEELFASPPKLVAELLSVELENLQRRLHESTRDDLAKHDARGVLVLSDDDKKTLDAMYHAACVDAMRDFSRRDQAGETVDRYQALTRKLFK